MYEFIEVESVEILSEVEDTFDITVENTHNFFANDMLVHNCLGGIYAGDLWENLDNGDEATLNAMRKTTENMRSIFGDRWYAELQWFRHPTQMKLNNLIIQVAKEYGLDLISTADSHYFNPTVWKDRELYKRFRPGSISFFGEMPENLEDTGMELYPKNGDQMFASYKKYSTELGEKFDDDLIRESIERTHYIAHNRIDKFYPDNTVRLPSFVVPEGMTEDDALSTAAINGLQAKQITQPEYINRLERELQVIKDRGFSRYFLTMKAIADKATSMQITGPSRGSAGGSLVAYALDITQVDPIKYGLLFSRFLRSDATDYPDIDYDVSDPMTLKETLINEWGEDNVAPISNWNTLQLRSLIKDIAKFYDIPYPEVNAVTKKMVFEAVGPAKRDHGIKTGVYDPTFEELMKYSTTLQEFLKKYPQVETHVRTLRGQVRSCSRHAGGLVVGEELNKYMPLIYSGGVRQTPWTEGQNVRHLEPMGFIKFDILGLGTLRMIEDAILRILKKQGGDPTFDDVKKFYDKNLHPDILDFNDQKIYKNIFHKGKWAGVFQFTECLSGDTLVCMSDGSQKRIDRVSVGDNVVSYNEETGEYESKEVLRFLDQGVKETYTITMEDKTTIRATAEHLFLTSNRGWIKLKDLTEEDDVLSY